VLHVDQNWPVLGNLIDFGKILLKSGFCKKSLKMLNWYSETVNRRGQAMKWSIEKNKRQKMGCKTFHRKPKIEQREPH